MCTFNGARHVRDQLASIAAQTRPPDELLVSDDHSSDGTPEIVERFAATVPFPVRLRVNQRNLGSTKNFEHAIRQCEGDIIALSDQDDVWRPEKLARAESALQGTPDAGAVFSDGEVVDEGLRPLGQRLWQAAYFGAAERALLGRGRAIELLVNRNVVAGGTLAFHSRFRPLLLPIPPGWFQDAWIALLVAACAELVCIPEPLIAYRRHPGQLLGITLIGEAPNGVRRRPVTIGRPPPRDFRNVADTLQMACDRLRSVRPPQHRPERLACLEAKIAHLRARAALPPSRLGRVPPVFKELVAGRYHRFSNAWRSVVRDLWF
jgi:hypothetical protein